MASDFPSLTPLVKDAVARVRMPELDIMDTKSIDTLQFQPDYIPMTLYCVGSLFDISPNRILEQVLKRDSGTFITFN